MRQLGSFLALFGVVLCGCGGGGGTGPAGSSLNTLPTNSPSVPTTGGTSSTATPTPTTGSTTGSTTTGTPAPPPTNTSSLIGNWSGSAGNNLVGTLSVNSDNTLSGQFVGSDGTSVRVNGNWSQYYSGANGASATVSGSYSNITVGTVALASASQIFIDTVDFTDGHLRGSIFAIESGQQTLVLTFDLSRA